MGCPDPLREGELFEVVILGLGSRVVSVLDSGLFTPIVPVFTKQQNW